MQINNTEVVIGNIPINSWPTTEQKNIIITYRNGSPHQYMVCPSPVKIPYPWNIIAVSMALKGGWATVSEDETDWFS